MHYFCLFSAPLSSPFHVCVYGLGRARVVFGLTRCLQTTNGAPAILLTTGVSVLMPDKGMLLMTTGTRQTLRFMPPLVVTEAEIDECLEILSSAITEVQIAASN